MHENGLFILDFLDHLLNEGTTLLSACQLRYGFKYEGAGVGPDGYVGEREVAHEVSLG